RELDLVPADGRPIQAFRTHTRVGYDWLDHRRSRDQLCVCMGLARGHLVRDVAPDLPDGRRRLGSIGSLQLRAAGYAAEGRRRVRSAATARPRCAIAAEGPEFPDVLRRVDPYLHPPRVLLPAREP